MDTRIIVGLSKPSFWDKVRNAFIKPVFAILVKEEDMPIDPLTAIMNFLTTPVGQKFADPLVTFENAILSDFGKVIQDLITLAHNKIAGK